MNKNLFLIRLVSCAVILCMVCAELEPACLNNPSAFTSLEFRGVIKPFALIANLLNRRNPDYEDLVLIRSVLADHLGIANPDALTLVYNKDKRELFAYTGSKFLQFYKSNKTIFRENPIKQETIGRIKIVSYEFSEELQVIARGIKDAFILGPERTKIIPIPKRLNSDLYKKTRFWLGLLLLVTTSPVFLAIYGVYSVFEYIADLIQKRRLDEEGYQSWIEKRRYALLSFGIPILRILPFLRTELMVKMDEIDKFNKELEILARPEVFSEKKMDSEKIRKIIYERNRTLLNDRNFREIKKMLRDIMSTRQETSARNLLKTLDNTPVYLVAPGRDVDNPFIYDDGSANSYVYTFVAEELPEKQGVTAKIMRMLRTRSVSRQILPLPRNINVRKNTIYISSIFYEQLSRNKPLLMALLAEKILYLANIPPAESEKILARINALNTTGVTLNEAKTIIKMAYFRRQKEFSPLSKIKGKAGKWMRKKILAFIDWSQQYDGWFQFLKLMMSEFFTITVNWIRTPFLYPIRKSLHCGMPTPDNPLPEYGSYLWALQCGFSEAASRLISEADTCTDNVTKGWAPKTGSQSRHFNIYLHDKRWEEAQGLIGEDLSQLNVYYSGPFAEKLIRGNYEPSQQFSVPKSPVRLTPDRRWSEVNYPDTRLDWAQYELERAAHFYRMGEKKKALECLGRGLHSLQDLTAHMEFDTGPFGTRMHPSPYDDPEYDLDESGILVLSHKRIRVKDTERLTKLYLELAKGRFNKIDDEPEKERLTREADAILRNVSSGPVEPAEKNLLQDVSV